jgi:hypothetical protein
MTVGELFRVSPQCWVFIRCEDGTVRQCTPADSNKVVRSVLATNYPMYKHVLEVVLEK